MARLMGPVGGHFELDGKPGSGNAVDDVLATGDETSFVPPRTDEKDVAAAVQRGNDAEMLQGIPRM